MTKRLANEIYSILNTPDFCGDHCTKPLEIECNRCLSEYIAEHLIKSGAILPPCPIGSTVYLIVTKRPKVNFPEFSFIKKSTLTYTNLERIMDEWGINAFATNEEAKIALSEKEAKK